MEINLPIFETRQVLFKHLIAKIKPLCKGNFSAEELTNEIIKDLNNKEIIQLLQNDDILEKITNEIILKKTSDKEYLGEEIFKIIAETESELCAQITGMLLELDKETLKNLLLNKSEFHLAVEKAKKEYLEFILVNSETNEKLIETDQHQEVGEILYELVRKYYPDPNLASRLTGMLLELEISTLNELVSNSKELQNKLTIAINALNNINS